MLLHNPKSIIKKDKFEARKRLAFDELLAIFSISKIKKKKNKENNKFIINNFQIRNFY